jgi:hypothetical protein
MDCGLKARLSGRSGHSLIASIHPETLLSDVILRSPANGGTTKNLIVSVAAEILRFAQNDIREFPDGH